MESQRISAPKLYVWQNQPYIVSISAKPSLYISTRRIHHPAYIYWRNFLTAPHRHAYIDRVCEEHPTTYTSNTQIANKAASVWCPLPAPHLKSSTWKHKQNPIQKISMGGITSKKAISRLHDKQSAKLKISKHALNRATLHCKEQLIALIVCDLQWQQSWQSNCHETLGTGDLADSLY